MSAQVFGKLPAHGDFIARGIAPDAREALDQWLAASLADARAAFGDAFDAHYEQAPPWRFAWAEGARWTAGAMALSVDAVGRRYPILVALDGLPGEAVEGAADAAENLLYDALEGGWDADRLHAAATGITVKGGEVWQGGDGWWTLGGERFPETGLVGARPDRLMTTMLTPLAVEEQA
ncbi:type VI secretion system-associated protein TagF [Sphingomonas sp.]|uniref:type VI secretion system-associated protein TagF n=1 Tax=Sphingomonas sp. TaxID=28214 RepID=UPI002D80941C|nr:type VI secretion system-associated protein TagF [Sphingomonas sp.]HEU0044795.1 type VI secretion system-associated protein TagF [Sphingomonas sp.]